MRYIFLFVWYCLTVQAQTTYFNKVHYTDTTSMLTVAGLPTQDGYLIAGDFNAPNNYSAFFIRKLDQAGNQQDYYILDGDNIHMLRTILFGNSFIKTIDNQYAIVGSKGIDIDNRNFIFIKFNEQGQLLNQLVFEQVNQKSGNAQLIPLEDGNYILGGWMSDQLLENGPKFYIMKFNESGDIAWENRFGVWATQRNVCAPLPS